MRRGKSGVWRLTGRGTDRPVLLSCDTMSLMANKTIDCPYCGERIDLVIDIPAGDQDYIEDCQVCCRPIQLHVVIDAGDGVVQVEARRDDE